MFITCPNNDAIALDSALPSRYILGLSKEVLNFHFGPGATKLWVPNFVSFELLDFCEYYPVHHYIKRSLEPKRS